MRPIIKMEEKGKAEVSKESVNEVINLLGGYLREDYVPEKYGYSKYAMMGPVGKLLSVLISGRFQNEEALLGYIVNIHSNTARDDKKQLSKEAIERLNRIIRKLGEIRKDIPQRMWLKTLREIDYGVYFQKYGEIAEKVEAKRTEKGGEK